MGDLPRRALTRQVDPAGEGSSHYDFFQGILVELAE
jgi:hypothetical protein